MKQQLNERQLSVLQWVEQGCLDGVWETSSYKISCQALQNRGLLKVSKRQGQWSATLTSAGRHYLQHGNYPPAQPQARLTTPVQKPTPAVPAESTGIAAAEPAVPAVPRKTPQAWQTRKTVAEQLLEELAEAGGRIIKNSTRGPNAVNWPARVSAARRSGRIPKTKELYGGWCREGYEIRLMDIPAWRLAVLEPIPVPARLTQPHAVVRALQSQSPPMGLTKAVQARALRLVQALITAAQRRGHSSKIGATRGAPLPHRRRSAPSHFTITTKGQECGFLIIQEQDRSEHTPTEKELAEAKKYSWVKIPRFDYTPADRLRITVSGGQPHRASEWADTTDRTLEDQLAEIAQEVDLRGEAAERKRLADLEAAKQKRLRWEAAIQQARAEHAEAYRVKHFEAQEEAWRRATRLAEYLSAVRLQVGALPTGQVKAETEAWTAWADAHLERLNPLNAPPRLPKVPEPRAEDLKPFLHGWSPYGPNS
ncbi:hypothetical protein [Streptomyces roseoverticillatus]|uniref:hypothetical protein n=1 Tax=Streptomyces roseoverticillatus TaxID=66429 RepID=UPI0004C231EE|nr:hypothetical protein [Streptomyces roseoverticillatus]